ncbi:hypothetical protein CUMW_123520 [Citrus unshiu]|nr:hypothetical protein CUMW_123520 [Citrus unshiu]
MNNPATLAVENRPESRRLSSKILGQDPFSPPLIPPPLGSCSSTHTHHFPTDHDHQGRRLCCKRPPESSQILELRSTAIAARGDSRAPPLDSPRSELSDLSFPLSLTEVRSPLTEVRSPLTGRGNSEDPRTRIIPQTLLIPSLDFVTELMNRQWLITIKHIYREANFAADSMAKLAGSLPLGLHVFENSPEGLGYWLCNDIYGTSIPRSVLA